jgi:hypothetical protein
MNVRLAALFDRSALLRPTAVADGARFAGSPVVEPGGGGLLVALRPDDAGATPSDATLVEPAPDAEGVFDALELLARRARARAGESPGALAAEPPLQAVDR